jgi:hypothetical protein
MEHALMQVREFDKHIFNERMKLFLNEKNNPEEMQRGNGLKE